MGFINLPEMHWDDTWKQPQVTRAFARHRFEELQRWWHISPPPPTDAPESLIDKVNPLYEHC